MRWVTFRHSQGIRYGVLEGDEICVVPNDRSYPDTLRAALTTGPQMLGELARRSKERASQRVPLAGVRLLPPIPDPRKYLCIGGNYRSHLEEAARRGFVHGNATQVWFNKQVSCVRGPYDEIHRPRVSEQLDYEGELGIIIGQRCRNVPRAAAYQVIAGYVVCNDLSVRDWQLRSPTGTLGKSFDTHGPFGPCLVTAEEISDPHSLQLTTHVNGELRQSANTGEMINDVAALLQELTTAVTLEPGDVLATGTPAGVGGLMQPPRFLVPGDVVRVEIKGLGYIENQVIEEPMAALPLAPSVPPLTSDP